MKKSISNHAVLLLPMFGVLFLLQTSDVPCARADDLKGSEDPELRTAIDIWLLDNDRESLPVLASLAADGNIAARVLLARIEGVDRAPRQFVSNLSRKERVGLFRSTTGKGVFRPSWLKFEAQNGNQTASVLLRASELQVDIEAVRKLYEIGEPEASYDLIRQVGANGTREEKVQLLEFLPDNSELAPYVRALRDPQEGVSPGLAALQLIADGKPNAQPAASLKDAGQDTITAARFIESGYQTGFQSIDFNQENRHYVTLASWINSELATTAIARLCRQHCDEAEINDCAVTAFGLTGGYYNIIQFDSPVESLIDQTRYVSSDRASGMLLRRISTVKRASGSGLLASDSLLWKKSACLAGFIDDHTES